MDPGVRLAVGCRWFTSYKRARQAISKANQVKLGSQTSFTPFEGPPPTPQDAQIPSKKDRKALHKATLGAEREPASTQTTKCLKTSIKSTELALDSDPKGPNAIFAWK